jgi:hypothetical protein
MIAPLRMEVRVETDGLCDAIADLSAALDAVGGGAPNVLVDRLSDVLSIDLIQGQLWELRTFLRDGAVVVRYEPGASFREMLALCRARQWGRARILADEWAEWAVGEGYRVAGGAI